MDFLQHKTTLFIPNLQNDENPPRGKNAYISNQLSSNIDDT